MNALEAKLRIRAEHLAWVIASTLLQFIEMGTVGRRNFLSQMGG